MQHPSAFDSPSSTASRTTRAAAISAALIFGSAFMFGCSDGPSAVSPVDESHVALAISGVSGESIVIDPRNATLEVGYGAIVRAIITDAAGAPVTGVRPTWSSSDSSLATVAVLPDSGFTLDGMRAAVVARAAGSVRIVVAHAGRADTAHFTIRSRSGSPGTPVDSGSVTRPSRFDLTARVTGISQGPVVGDSATWTLTPVAGAIVRFVQLPRAAGDTLPSASPPVSAPTVIATATTDNAGIVSFPDMPAARFRLEVEPPAGTSWASRTFEYAAPFTGTLRLELPLPRR